MYKFVVVTLLLGSATACKGKDEDKKPAPAPAPAETTGSAAPAAPASAPPTAGNEPVDVCALLPSDKIVSVTGGTLSGEPKPQPAQGSFLGGCNYSLELGGKFGMASVSARPASELEQTIKFAKGSPITPEGVVATEKTGAFAKLDGKPYFLQVLVAGASGIDGAKSAELAKAYTGK